MASLGITTRDHNRLVVPCRVFPWLVLARHHCVLVISPAPSPRSRHLGWDKGGYGFMSTGEKYCNGTGGGYGQCAVVVLCRVLRVSLPGSQWEGKAVLGCLLRADAGEIEFFVNGQSLGTAAADVNGREVRTRNCESL